MGNLLFKESVLDKDGQRRPRDCPDGAPEGLVSAGDDEGYADGTSRLCDSARKRPVADLSAARSGAMRQARCVPWRTDGGWGCGQTARHGHCQGGGRVSRWPAWCDPFIRGTPCWEPLPSFFWSCGRFIHVLLVIAVVVLLLQLIQGRRSWARPLPLTAP